jgi:hypothetical protein
MRPCRVATKERLNDDDILLRMEVFNKRKKTTPDPLNGNSAGGSKFLLSQD